MSAGAGCAFRTVLVVDDDRVLARMVSERLQQERIATLTAHDLFEALRIVTTRRVDAIILDLHMPTGNGDELVRQLKELRRTSAIPVIILTGSAEAEDGARLLELGADAFMQKPPDFERLLARLQRLMERPSPVFSTN